MTTTYKAYEKGDTQLLAAVENGGTVTLTIYKGGYRVYSETVTSEPGLNEQLARLRQEVERLAALLLPKLTPPLPVPGVNAERINKALGALYPVVKPPDNPITFTFLDEDDSASGLEKGSIPGERKRFLAGKTDKKRK